MEPTVATTADHPRPRRGIGVVLLCLALLAAMLGGITIGSTFLGRPAANTSPSPVDVGFAQDMSVHHAQAVQMASIELAGGADLAVTNLAYDILTTQQNQIGRMQGWLIAWGDTLLPADGYMAWMHGSAMATMPGMASDAEIARLRTSVGADRDLLFLQLMLRHHQGAIEMLDVATKGAETPYVRDLATQMSMSQNSEITLLQRLIADREADPLPFP